MNINTIDYKGCSDEEFDSILKDIVTGMSAAQILDISGVYEILREEFNNEVLDKYEERHICSNCGESVIYHEKVRGGLNCPGDDAETEYTEVP